VHGEFDYNKTQLAPLCCAVQLQNSKNTQKMWDIRSGTGWYLGASKKHYRCHIIFCQKTCAERISDTVIFQHKYITQPTITPANRIVKAIDDLESALCSKTNHQGIIKMDILHQMHAIFNNNMVVHNNKKKITFAQPIPEQRVALAVTIPYKAEMPVVHNASRVTSAVIDKPIGLPTARTSGVKTCSTSRIEAIV
jgi:hypothetical protein